MFSKPEFFCYQAFEKIYRELHRYNTIALFTKTAKLPEPNEARSEVYQNISRYLTVTMEEIKSDLSRSVKYPKKLLRKLDKFNTDNSKVLPQIKDFTTLRAFDEIYMKSLKLFLRQSQKTLRRFRIKKCNKIIRMTS